MAKAKMIGYFKPETPNKKADMWMEKQNHFPVVLQERRDQKRRDAQNGKQVPGKAEKAERAEPIETVHII